MLLTGGANTDDTAAARFERLEKMADAKKFSVA